MLPRRNLVPLSEHEQRLLEQMERALHAEDPKLASTLQGSRLRRHLRQRLFAAAVGVLVGAGLLGYGVYARRIALDIAGVAVVVGCAWLAWTTWRRVPAPGQIVPAFRLRSRAGLKAAARKTGGSTFMQRMELRWSNRRDREGF
jgi:small-conductance mechanosensitive channel